MIAFSVSREGVQSANWRRCLRFSLCGLLFIHMLCALLVGSWNIWVRPWLDARALNKLHVQYATKAAEFSEAEYNALLSTCTMGRDVRIHESEVKQLRCKLERAKQEVRALQNNAMRPLTALTVKNIGEERKSLETAKTRYDEAVLADRKVPGVLLGSELACLKLEMEMAQLRLEYARLETHMGVARSTGD